MAATVLLLVITAVPGLATVNGGCSAVGTGSETGTVDLGAESVWHVKRDDSLTGQGASPNPPTKVQVSVQVFGLGFPLISSQGTLSSTGSAGPYPVSTLAGLARIVTVAGQTDACTGTIRIVVDDANLPLAELIGAILGILGLLGLLGSALMCGHMSARILGGASGLLGGTGVGLVLQQAGSLDPGDLKDLLIPLAGLVAGTLVASCCCPKADAATP
jgi:hypothetical protein